MGNIQGYTIFTVYFQLYLWFSATVTVNCFFLIAMTLNRPLKDNIQGKRQSNLVIVIFSDFEVVFTVSSFVDNPIV